jgi:hypothetical protein
MSSSSSNSPPGFLPRREFLREQQSPPNSFALLALSSSNFIRLYSFSEDVVATLRKLFDAQGVSIATREDHHHNLYEFSMDGKPWANAKSVTTEKLLLDIFAIIYHAGYTFLSNVDYGRDNDDRLAMAFSRPSAPDQASPLSAESPKKRVPFALSFASTTLLRVISPPLHLTPAILQAVRGAWPRGVVSEKTVGDNCFEFKLKGYKCMCLSPIKPGHF